MKNYLRQIDKILEFEPDPAFARRARIIFENLQLSGKEKVLEIGCGRGFYLKTLKSIWPDLKVTGIDLNQKYLDKARNFLGNLSVQLIKADATALPFDNKTFDRVIASEVLEHILDDKKAIAEMYRVLKPGGIAMVTVPNKNYPLFWDPLNWILERIFNWHVPSNIWWLAGIWADHVRLYDEVEIREKLGEEGFQIEKICKATHYCLPFSHFLLYGIGKNLVEKGLCKSFNRFGEKSSHPSLSKILLWIVRKVDRINEAESKDNKLSSVNLVLLVRKRI